MYIYQINRKAEYHKFFSRLRRVKSGTFVLMTKSYLVKTNKTENLLSS